MEAQTQTKTKFSGNYFTGIIKYGLLIGLGLSLFVLIRFVFNKSISSVMSYWEILSLMLLLFLGVWLYRKGLEEKQLSFKESYFVAFGSGIVGSIIYGMFIFVYANYIDSEFQGRCYDVQRAVETNSNLTNQQIEAMVKPSSIAASSMLIVSLISLLSGLIIAFLLMNKKRKLQDKEDIDMQDAKIIYTPIKDLEFTLGQFKSPFANDYLRNPADYSFINRNFITIFALYNLAK